MRVDKYLWVIRLYKTRTLATTACDNGRIKINNSLAKASRNLKEGDLLEIKKSPITYTFKVIQLQEQRVGAKLVPELVENKTPSEEIEKLLLNRGNRFVQHDKGSGRPTKRDRRMIDDFWDEVLDFDENE